MCLNLAIAAVAVAISVVLFMFSGEAGRSETAKTIKIVVPAAPGGAGDPMVRLVGEQIGRTQGLTALIENRAGAGGAIAAEAVSRTAPDAIPY